MAAYSRRYGGVTIETQEKSVKLKVSEALSKDVSRGYARMGPEDLALLQVDVGDIVEVAGKGRTVCNAMPAHKEMRGQSRIQLDGITRENAGTGNGHGLVGEQSHISPPGRPGNAGQLTSEYRGKDGKTRGLLHKRGNAGWSTCFPLSETPTCHRVCRQD